MKNLANQTANATDDIHAHITMMLAATEVVVRAIDGITGTVRLAGEPSVTITSAVGNQDDAAVQIARNVMEAYRDTTQVSEQIAEVTKAAESAGLMAAQTLSAAANLRSAVGDFLGKVRAAWTENYVI